jgi:hypothetical protein
VSDRIVGRVWKGNDELHRNEIETLVVAHGTYHRIFSKRESIFAGVEEGALETFDDGHDQGWRGRGRFGGVESEGEGPEMIGVAGVVAGRRDGDSARRADEPFGLAQVIAQGRVDWDLDGPVFESLQQICGEVFGEADRMFIRLKTKR